MKGTRNDQQFELESEAYICSACGTTMMDSSQSVDFSVKLSDAYRSANGLLTGRQIKVIRGELAMSQQQFAEYLRVGVASIKRWEVGQIQDKAMDELIRIKTDPVYTQRLLQELRSQTHQETVVSNINASMQLSYTSIQRFEKRQPMVIDFSGMTCPDDLEEDQYPLAA